MSHTDLGVVKAINLPCTTNVTQLIVKLELGPGLLRVLVKDKFLGEKRGSSGLLPHVSASQFQFP